MANTYRVPRKEDLPDIMMPGENTLTYKGELPKTVKFTGKLAIGSMVGYRYQVVDILGEGGMGTVYKVLDLRRRGRKGDVYYALKINKKTSPDFMKEAMLPARLSTSNPNIIRPVYMGHDDTLGVDYIVMEYVDGIALSKRCSAIKNLMERECMVVAYEVCQALLALESCGILHCDIKPSNIMLDDAGVVRLTDFGISMKLAVDREGDASSSSSSTSPKSGTPMYASPEQLLGDSTIDFRSDIYSLGATLYDLATGVHAFPGKSANDVLFNRYNQPTPRRTPHQQNSAISQPFSELIMKMMAPERQDRPENVQSVLDSLLQIGCPPGPEARTMIMRQLRVREEVPAEVNKLKELFKREWSLPKVILNIPMHVWGIIGLLLVVFFVFWIVINLPL